MRFFECVAIAPREEEEEEVEEVSLKPSARNEDKFTVHCVYMIESQCVD